VPCYVDGDYWRLWGEIVGKCPMSVPWICSPKDYHQKLRIDNEFKRLSANSVHSGCYGR
jgi:hypothetical protein